MTSTLTVQEPLAGIDVPAIARLAPPLAAVIVPPVHVVAALVVAAFTRPAGYVSVNATPVMADVFALVSVTVSVEVAPVVIGLAEKALATDGWLRTFNVPVAAAALPAFVVEMAPVLFRYAPAVADVTLTVIVQEPDAGTVALASTRLVPLLAAVTAPPTHVVAPAAAAVFTRPAG